MKIFKSKKLNFGLTSEECKVLNLMKAGYSNLQIAIELKISEDSVKTHIREIFSKLKTFNRIQVVTKTIKEKII